LAITMTYLHPALLWLLPLAAIPLVLHLLTLHRLKTVELSTFRFLFDSYVQQRRRMQFLEALLAILRMLFILLLVFLFCRPVFSSWDALFGGKGSGGREVIILMDCSASMNARTAGKSALERAKEAAQSVVDHLGSEDRLTLIRVGAQPEEVFSRYTTDMKDIHARINALKPTSSRGNIFLALQSLFGPEATTRHKPAVYIFTDCQATGWRELQKKKEDIVPEGTPVWVVNVGSSEHLSNVAVVGTAPRRNRAIVGLPFLLEPRVVNYSKTETFDGVVTVSIDQEEVGRPLAVSLKPGESKDLRVNYTPRPNEKTRPILAARQSVWQRGEFKVTATKTPDRFPDDDSFKFTLQVVPRVKVLVVNDNGSDDQETNEGFYLSKALTISPESIGEKAGPLQASKEFLRGLDVTPIAETGLTAEMLLDTSVVVLANCGALTPPQYELLRGFVNQGGGLMIFPGDKVNPEVYNTQFFPVPGPQGIRLTGANLGAAQGDPAKFETFDTLEIRDLTHPVFSAFHDPALNHFKKVRIYKRYPLTFKGKPSNAVPLAYFGSGGPALVESRLGDGLVVLAAFPAHTRWTNLPARPDFPPLVLRLASHLEHRSQVEVPAVVTADSSVEISVSSNWGKIEGVVKSPSDVETKLEQFERTGPYQSETFTHTAERGYYTVEIKNDRLDRTKTATQLFAVNLAPEESDFTMASEKQLREYLAGGDLTFVDASAKALEEKGPIGGGDEIWRLLIWSLFPIIGIEFLLATLAGHRRDDEDNRTVSERLLQLSPGSWVSRMTGGGR
jgi:hypothetical protein